MIPDLPADQEFAYQGGGLILVIVRAVGFLWGATDLAYTDRVGAVKRL